jgi:rod shape-determining protein MreD
MGIAVLALLSWVAASVPDACPSWLGLSANPPDLFVALAAYLALRGQGTAAVKWGILLGAAKDCLSLDPLGSNAFVLGVVAQVFGRREGHAPLDGLARAVATGAAALFASWLYLLRMAPVSHGTLTFSAFLGAVPSALATAVLAPPLFSLLDRTRVLDGLAGRGRLAA